MKKICLILSYFCLIFFFGCQAEESNKNKSMNKDKVTFNTTDDLIKMIKENYNQKGLSGVTEWVNNNFKENTTLTIARDISTPSNVETAIIHDRVIIKLNNRGEETEVYYLEPIYENTFSGDLFLSIRLNFIEEPFELLLFSK